MFYKGVEQTCIISLIAFMGNYRSPAYNFNIFMWKQVHNDSLISTHVNKHINKVCDAAIVQNVLPFFSPEVLILMILHFVIVLLLTYFERSILFKMFIYPSWLLFQSKTHSFIVQLFSCPHGLFICIFNYLTNASVVTIYDGTYCNCLKE